MDIHVFLHGSDGKLDEILSLLRTVLKQEKVMSQELDTLTAQVSACTTIEQSAVALIQGLAAQITAAGTDPVALTKLASDLRASSDALGAAIQANTTPPAPAPVGPQGGRRMP